MKFSMPLKVVAAVAYVVAVVLAGTIHWWIAFSLVWLGVVGVLLAIHFRWRARRATSGVRRRRGQPEVLPRRYLVTSELEEFERRNDEEATDPLYKHEAGNIWHRIHLH